MKQLFGWMLLLLFMLPAAAQERILNYNIGITIETSGTLDVVEEISVVAEGSAIRRGIYRSFPTRYTDRLGNRFTVDFEVVGVTRNGEPEPWFIEKSRNGVILNLGSDALIAPGVHTYVIHYQTTRQVGFFEEYDELYFNAIGADWSFMIEKAEVQLVLPDNAGVIQSAAYMGFEGATGCDCTQSVTGNRIIFTAQRWLAPGEQFTIAVAWPKGYVVQPTRSEEASHFMKDNLYLLLAILGLIAGLLLYLREWRKVGKDPARGTIIPLFDPPANFTPGASGYLMARKMSQRTYTAMLINAAVKGHLRIEKQKRTYFLERVQGGTGSLSAEEERLLDTLFAGGSKIELHNKNHQVLSRAQEKAGAVLKKLLSPRYFSWNSKHLVKGLLASVTGLVMAAFLSPSAAGMLVTIFLAFIMLMVFIFLMEAPTKEGRAILDALEGFKMYVKVAEKDQLDGQHEPDLTPERFEKLLPYAIALGVENQWGKKFENALSRALDGATQRTYQPLWYAGAGKAMLAPHEFTASIGKSFSSAISSASTPPGKSSGSGGGGFAGGGGGGGGGGGR